MQKFAGRVNRRERNELAFFIKQSSPCAGAVSNDSAPNKVSGAEHLPVRHPLSPLFAEPNRGHGRQETLERISNARSLPRSIACTRSSSTA